MPRMDDDELKAIVAAEINSAVGSQDTELSNDRVDGWDAYLKQPYGNEVEGRSSVVSSDVQDTVEWILPSLMRIFTAGDSVEFLPFGPEDEDKAKQATDYCNYVFDKDNPGFLNQHTWFKEALIAKLGTLKIYWEVKDKWKRERYSGLDDDAYAMVVGSPDVEIVEHTERQVLDGPEGMVSVAPGVNVPMRTAHDVVVKMKTEAGKICVVPVPGDEVLFSRDAKDPQTCRFFGHKSKRTVSDLIEQYPDKKTEIENISSDGPGGAFRDESTHRSVANEDDQSPYTSAVNKAMREIWVTEGYIRVDYDGDGIAEMRKVTTAGPSAVILDNEEWEGPRPFACVCPILMPHRLVGLSIPDLIKDIQLIKTAILRQYLDALYIATNPRYEVDTSNIVDPAEVLTSKPGGLVRKHNANQALIPLATANVSGEALQGLQYVDQLRENRTGVSPRTQGLGSETLHDTKGGQELLFDAAKMRVELIARIFAETGVKDAFKLILWLSNKYQDKARTVRLRNKWVEMDPREWSEEYDMTANVGLGHNDQTQKIMALNMIAGAQEKIVALQGGASGPLVNLDNIHNAATKLAEAAGFQAPELFFSDPNDPNNPPPAPKPDPKMAEVQGKLQLEQQKAQMDAKMQAQKSQTDMQMSQQQAAVDMQLQQAKLEQEMMFKREQMVAEFALKREQMNMEMQLRREEMAANAVLAERDSQRTASITKTQMGGELG